MGPQELKPRKRYDLEGLWRSVCGEGGAPLGLRGGRGSCGPFRALLGTTTSSQTQAGQYVVVPGRGGGFFLVLGAFRAQNP